MHLSYYHVAGDVPERNNSQTAVVIDVLRATTTIAYALNNGAASVETFADLELLKKQAALWPSSQRILLGERGGRKLDGFDLGNSPLGVIKEVVKDKRIFMSTTNGTRSFARVRDFNNLYAMSLVNRKAVAEQLLLENADEILILGSGWEGAYSLEDSLAAGALASYLLNSTNQSVQVVNDELNSAIALWTYWETDLIGCLRKSTHGQRLQRLGNHDEDFLCCSELDNISTVPIQREKGILFSL